MKDKKPVHRSQDGGSRLRNVQVPTINSDRQVNNLLHTLRGEQFRHAQNVSGSKLRVSSASSYTLPTLPLFQIFGRSDADATEVETAPVQPAPFRTPGEGGHWRRAHPPVTLIEGVPTYGYPDGPVPGPKPPKSWSALFDKEERNTPSWRASALSVVFSQLLLPADASMQDRSLQPLTRICLRVLLSACSTPIELAEVAPYISAHLRRDIMRWCAVYQPLSSGKLYALCGGEGHADGELVVVGPEANFRVDFIKRVRGRDGGRSAPLTLLEEDAEWEPRDDGDGSAKEELDDWDKASPDDSPTPLTSLVLLKADLQVPSVLPPTLTHLALLALPHPTHVHHLPRTCPLLEVLDLSFNSWLGEKDTAQGTLGRVEWGRWHRLRLLGMRECGVTRAEVAKVNVGRWTDVEIIGIEERDGE